MPSPAINARTHPEKQIRKIADTLRTYGWTLPIFDGRIGRCHLRGHVRDKVAASKRKGMWMGGTIPLGYDVVDRKLVLKEWEAETIRHIFRPLSGTRFGAGADFGAGQRAHP